MPDFSYVALATSGQRSNGTLTAGSEREAMAQLDSRGLFPIKITAAKSAASGGRGTGRRIKSRHMATFYSQLADLIRSGVPLLKGLDLLERMGSQPALQEVLREVRMQVADGTSLADAMARFPNAFSELAVSMVRAGQEGGFLEDVLKRIADFTENQEDLKAKVVGALAYPVFLAIIGFIVLNILVIFFVPKFEPIFVKLREKDELPVLTQLIMDASHILQRQWMWVIAVIGLAYFGFRRWARSESGRLRLDALKLRLPGAGAIFRQYSLSRFTRILGTMLHNGIPILQALDISKDSTGNKVLSAAIAKSAENIKGGETLAAPLAACPYFPRDVVEMISVGEESNSLETVLIEIASTLEKRTTRQLDLFVRLLEPVMLLVMAGVILVVVAGLLLPVFKMSSAVG
jgi:type II secretory pathway component PulF